MSDSDESDYSEQESSENEPSSDEETDEKDKCYILRDGTKIFFKKSGNQQLYIENEGSNVFADLSITKEFVSCAGEWNSALYFYHHNDEHYYFYRAFVQEMDQKKSIGFEFVRAKRDKGHCFFSTQQPFIMEKINGQFKLESFDGTQLISLDYCRRFLKEIDSTDFFCHRGRAYLLKRANETKIVNAGHLRIIHLEKPYFFDAVDRPKDCWLTRMHLRLVFGKEKRNSIYAQDFAPIYVLCKNALLVIGPLLDHFFIDIKTSDYDYIVGVEGDKIIVKTSEGLVKTTLGKKHDEMCERLRKADSLNDDEIALDRNEISRLHEELEQSKMREERVKTANTKLKKENKKLRRNVSQITADDKTDSLFLPSVPDEEYLSKFSNEFAVTKILGEGSFGIVFQTMNKLDDWNYAVKRIAVAPNEATMQKSLGEVRKMARMDHPGIIRYNAPWVERPPMGWQAAEDEKIADDIALPSGSSIKYHSPNSFFIYIQMQLCAHSLHAWLEDNRDASSREPARMKSWFKQVVEAVKYIHDQGLIHRDLKPHNILFADENHIKICDLGIATDQHFEDGKEVSTLRTNLFTALYMSPEQNSQFPMYSSRTDIFSMGLIFAELCVVMSEDERQKIFDYYRYRKGSLQDDLFADVETSNFVSWIAAKSSKERPRCEEILSHPLMNV